MVSTADKAKGHAKEAAGDLTGNDDLEREGKLDKAKANVKDKVDSAKDKVDSVIDSAREKLD
ncbi:MAG: CsbD family protein [Acidimicrobiia bacterium]|nr:CsbD family protein [Acidimicrobiia bacterium]